MDTNPSSKTFTLIEVTEENLLDLIRQVVETSISRCFEEYEHYIKEDTIHLSELITIEEVCELLSKTKPTIYNYIRKGIIKGYRLDGTNGLFFKRSEILNSLKQISIKYPCWD